LLSNSELILILQCPFSHVGPYIFLKISRKLVGLIKMCLNETYSRVRIGKYLSDKFTVQNGLKQGNDISPLLWNMPSGGSKKTRKD
jgi:hypothetical protein